MKTELKYFLYFIASIISVTVLWVTFVWYNQNAPADTLNNTLTLLHILPFSAVLLLTSLLQDYKNRAALYICLAIAVMALPFIICWLIDIFYHSLDNDITSHPLFLLLLIALIFTEIISHLFLLFYVSLHFWQKKISAQKTYIAFFILFLWGILFPARKLPASNNMQEVLFSYFWEIDFSSILSGVFFFISVAFLIFLKDKDPNLFSKNNLNPS